MLLQMLMAMTLQELLGFFTVIIHDQVNIQMDKEGIKQLSKIGFVEIEDTSQPFCEFSIAKFISRRDIIFLRIKQEMIDHVVIRF